MFLGDNLIEGSVERLIQRHNNSVASRNDGLKVG
jgi:hypothetical protein